MVKQQKITTPTHRRIAVIGATHVATKFAMSRPDVLLDIFDIQWPAIDEARDRLAQAGLANRVSIHHAEALRFVDVGTYDSVINLPASY